MPQVVSLNMMFEELVQKFPKDVMYWLIKEYFPCGTANQLYDPDLGSDT